MTMAAMIMCVMMESKRSDDNDNPSSLQIMMESSYILPDLTNERQGYIYFKANTLYPVIGQEASRPMRESNALKSFVNPNQYELGCGYP